MFAAAVAHAEGGKKIGDVKPPEVTAPLASWTPVQQWMPPGGWGSDPRSAYGYGSLSGALVLADELGDKFGQLGRASLVATCFAHAKEDTTSTLLWAMCGPEVAAIDMKKLEAELVAEGISPDSRADVLDKVKEALDKAQKVGAAVTAAAKDDPGVASVVKLGDAARTEWGTFASANREGIDRYLALKDAARSGKSNNKGYTGCFEATQAPFAKLVRATKFPWDMPGDPIPGYVSYLVGTTEGYLTTVSYAACAYGQSDSGAGLYVAAANQAGGHARAGARSLALAKAFDPAFKPKFAERSLAFDDMKSAWRDGIQMPGVNDVTAIMTPGGGVIGSLKPDGDGTKVHFKGDSVEECLEWKETSRVQQVSPNGSISYEKVCKKRGMVANQEDDKVMPSKYVAGLAPGVTVTVVNQFPVVAWKGKKLIAVLGVAIK